MMSLMIFQRGKLNVINAIKSRRDVMLVARLMLFNKINFRGQSLTFFNTHKNIIYGQFFKIISILRIARA
jgi:hypothetical protein